jgi:hypothetical protein
MKTLIALTLTAAIGATAGTAHAEKWRCLYKGDWVTTKTGNTAKMDWLLDWTLKGDHWEVIGDYNDKYGHAWFDGTCDDDSCDFVQSYKSGKLKGKKYFFTGGYHDEAIDETHTRNTFRGTWGYTAGDRTDGGEWRSIATCEKLDD